LGDHITRRQIPSTIERGLDVGNRPARFTIKVTMFLQIGAIARRSTIQVDLFHQTPINQSFQTVINCRQGDRRHMLFSTKKHLRRGRVIPLLHQQPEDLFTLFGQAYSTGSKTLHKFRRKLHGKSKLPRAITISRIILKDREAWQDATLSPAGAAKNGGRTGSAPRPRSRKMPLTRRRPPGLWRLVPRSVAWVRADRRLAQ
jgi:hypothetical protein